MQKRFWPSWLLVTTCIVAMAGIFGMLTEEWRAALAIAAFFVWFYPAYWKINRWIDARS